MKGDNGENANQLVLSNGKQFQKQGAYLADSSPRREMHWCHELALSCQFTEKGDDSILAFLL